MKHFTRVALTGMLSAVAMVGNAQAFTWVRDGIGRNQEFIQQGGALSKPQYTKIPIGAYAETWVDCTPLTLQAGGLIEATIAIRPGFGSTALPSARWWRLLTAASLEDAMWGRIEENYLFAVPWNGGVLSEQLLPWQTAEGYDEYLVRWSNPVTVQHKWVCVLEEDVNGIEWGRCRLVQGTSSLYATDAYVTSITQGTYEAFPNTNLSFANPVPEPGTCSVLGLGVVAALRVRRSQRRVTAS